MKIFYATAFLIFTLLGSIVETYAEEISVKATIDKTSVEVGSCVRYKLKVYGTFDDKVMHQLAVLEGFSIGFGPLVSIDTDVVDGSVSVYRRFLYGFTPKQLGTLTIGPTIVRYKRKEYRTESFNIEVTGRTPF